MPKTNNGGMRFVAVRDDLVVGLKEAKYGGDDEVERDDNMIGLLGSPLEVVFRPYLNRRGEREGKGYNRFVVGKME